MGQDVLPDDMFAAAIEASVRQLNFRIEQAIADLMVAENLSPDDLRERAVITHDSSGRAWLSLDGTPRIEWLEGPVVKAGEDA